MPKDARPPDEILEHIIASRIALTSVMYGLSEAELTNAHPVGKWSVKDVMAHIGRWETVCLDVIQHHLAGNDVTEYRNYNDFLAYNDQWEAELQALSLPEAIELFERSHYRLFGFLSALAPEKWDGYVRTWVQGATWHHFEEHCEQIRSWRASLR